MKFFEVSYEEEDGTEDSTIIEAPDLSTAYELANEEGLAIIDVREQRRTR